MILEIFNIDRLGKRIASKIIFGLMVLLKCSVYFLPIGDSDFTEFTIWAQHILGDYNAMMNMSVSDIPLTGGNILFIFYILAIDFICIMLALLYIGLFIRDYRVERRNGNSPKPISVADLTIRMIVLVFAGMIILLPTLTFVLYLFLFFIIIFPYIIMFPACYLSGDSGFFKSFGEMITKVKGYYLIILRYMSVILFVYIAADLIMSLVGQAAPFVNYVLDPFVTSFVLLAAARFIGMLYCSMVAYSNSRRKDVKAVNNDVPVGKDRDGII